MQPTFEEGHSRFMRNALRLSRALRWRVKGLLGQPRTLLVELRWRLGDEIMALPVIDALHEQFPGAAIEVLTNYPELFVDLPAIRGINPPSPAPDRYILLRGASRREYRPAVLFERAKLPLRDLRPALRFVEQSTAFLDTIPCGNGALVALAPGASWQSKRWPSECWEELAMRLDELGHRVVVLGQSGEGLTHGTDLAGFTTVYEAACLLHAVDLAVCCDSGLMHLALAADTPVVALFGPTDPDFLIRNEPRLTALRSSQSCSGFWNHAETVGEPGVCPDGHACCLESISVEQVLAAVRRNLVT